MSFAEGGTKFLQSIFKIRFDRSMSRKFEVEDTAILTLLSAMLDKVQTMEHLNKHRLPTEINTIFRTLIEQHFYITYIFQKYTPQRARAYFLHQRYEEFKKSMDVIARLKDRSLAKAVADSVNEKIQNSPSKGNTLQEELERYEVEYLKLFEAARIRNGGRRIPGQKGKNKLNWYNTEFKGLNTILDLSREIGEEELYFSFYGPLSMDVHGVDSPANIKIENIIDPDRNIAMVVLNAGHDEETTVDLAMALTTQAILKVARYYDMENTEAFRTFKNKYVININLRRLI